MVRSGRAVGARALTRAISDFGLDVTDLLAATGEQVRDIRAERETARQKAAAERESAALALTSAGVPADVATAWLNRRGLPAAGSSQLLDLAERRADAPHRPRRVGAR